MNRSNAPDIYKPNRYVRQFQSSLNALRLGFVFVRARSFKMPQSIKVAGTAVPLHYPPEDGVSNDFFACCIRDEYGLGRQLSKVRTILDIGANVGFFSMAARARFPQATIHAYEPNPRVLPFLKDNTAKLGVTVFPEAVGGESGYVSLADSGDTNQARTQASDQGNIAQVSLRTAIDRLGGNVDLLKLDCEGAEWGMFRSAGSWSNIRHIRMEYHLFSGESAEQVEEALGSLGFAVTHRAPSPGFGSIWAVRCGVSSVSLPLKT